MKLILSRKGFDSGSGGYPSPILPDGRLYSFPIPDQNPSRHPIRYCDLQHPGIDPAQLLSDLTQGKIPTTTKAHLDPDLDPASLDRLPHWQPSFGQARASERHLRNQGVGPGDLFLFFGWFRQVERHQHQYRYVKTAPDLHVLFGWLQIDRHIDMLQPATIPKWLHQHPHIQAHPSANPNGIYIARQTLDIPGLSQKPPQKGGGLFSQFHPQLRLTAPGQQRSHWQLPHWFWPPGEPPSLSYHRDPKRWQRDGDSVFLKTVGRGQEFVYQPRDEAAIAPWLNSLLRSNRTSPSQQGP
jgi:hypothetical protein